MRMLVSRILVAAMMDEPRVMGMASLARVERISRVSPGTSWLGCRRARWRR